MLRSEPAELQDAACLDLKRGPGPCRRHRQQRTARGKQRPAVAGEQRNLGIGPHRQLRHRWRSERRRIRHHDRDASEQALPAAQRQRPTRDVVPGVPPDSQTISRPPKPANRSTCGSAEAGRTVKVKPSIASSNSGENSRQSKP